HAADHDRLPFELQSLDAAGATEPATSLSSDCIQIGKRTFESKVGLIESHAASLALYSSAKTSSIDLAVTARRIQISRRAPSCSCSIRCAASAGTSIARER